MPQFTKYFPLTKVDESTHTISGIATSEQPDKDGEIADYEWCKTKAYPAWSKEAEDSTKAAGQEVSYGNIRVQHTLEIGGKVKAPPVFDDAEKSIHIDTEPENDSIWTKARKGFIRGFSQAGDYAWRKCNECFQKDRMAATDIPPEDGRDCPKCKKTVFVRYGPVLAEVSYVDNPCLKQATFSLVKADGTQELKQFEGSSAMEQTQAGSPAVTETVIDTAALPAQIAKAAPAPQAQAGAPAQPDIDIAALTAQVTKSVMERLGIEAPKDKAKKAVSAALDKAIGKKGVRKDLYDVSRLADLLQSLAYLRSSAVYERDFENDDSPLPEQLLNDLESLAETFLAMATEETKELTAIAGEKGQTKMSNTSALQKAHKSLAEHITNAKAAATEHSDKMCKLHKAHEASMHESLDKLHKVVGTVESDEKESSSAHEPQAIDPQKEGTPGSMKAAEAGFTKAQVDELVAKTVNETVQAIFKAMTEGDDSQGTSLAKAAPGIGDRSQVQAPGGPVIKSMPVTKTQDTQFPAASTEPLTQADISGAMSGDTAAALKFMKGARVETGVPATVMGAISAVKR